MKRKPEKNYKLPKYAAGLAALLLAGGMTGCTDPKDSEVQLDGDMAVPEDTKHVELSGDVEVVEDETATEPETTALSTEELVFEGDIVIEPEETCAISENAETGVVEFELGEPPANPVPTQELVLSGDIAME